MDSLSVFREFRGEFELVGYLERDADAAGDARFRYDEGYRASEHAAPLSAQLPLHERSFAPAATRAFFDAIAPEGSLRGDVQDVARVGRNDYVGILGFLHNEPIGAIVFSEDDRIDALEQAYEPLGFEALQRFAAFPGEESLRLAVQSRISLAGAQRKVGLYHEGCDPHEGWYVPKGAAPSTHILKVCSDSFPGESVCEALCMHAAKRLDLDVADCFLVEAGAQEPILAVERYDRCFLDGDVRHVDGLPVPCRLHQEDMCQAAGISSQLKYEATDANYLNLMSEVLRRNSTDYNGDRFMLAYYELFHYAVGNCDNHLKNWSMLWSADWESHKLAPLYDVVNTTLYPSFLREMGVSLCPSRVIDDVRRSDVLKRLESIGISGFLADSVLADMANDVPGALAESAQELSREGFPSAVRICDRLMPGVEERLKKLRG